MIGYPSPHKLTQGTIFTCAASEDYPTSEVRGLVITARCDVEHGKAPVISYLPLVKFQDWLFQDGVRILASRILASSRGVMKAAIRDAGLTDSIFDTLSTNVVREHLSSLTEKAQKAASKRYNDAEKLTVTVKAALAAAPGTKAAREFFDSQQKEYRKIVSDLLSNGIADYHFIERTEPDEVCQGYVALLREIRYLPIGLSNELIDGIDLNKFCALCKENQKYFDKLAVLNEDDYAMTVGLIESPFIELFMQRFTQLFSRIGVKDYSQELLQFLHSIVPFTRGETP